MGLIYQLQYVNKQFFYNDWVRGTLHNNKEYADRFRYEVKAYDPLVKYHKVKNTFIMIHENTKSVEGKKMRILEKYFNRHQHFKGYSDWEYPKTDSAKKAREIYAKMFGIDERLIGTIFWVSTGVCF